MKINSINNKIASYVKNNTFPQNLAKDLSKYLSKKVGRLIDLGDNFEQSRQDNRLTNIVTAYDSLTNNREIETASSIKAYWTLSKVLEGIDNKITNKRKYDKSYEEFSSEVYDYDKTDVDREYEKNYETLLEAIETVGKAYFENVYSMIGTRIDHRSLK